MLTLISYLDIILDFVVRKDKNMFGKSTIWSHFVLGKYVMGC